MASPQRASQRTRESPRYRKELRLFGLQVRQLRTAKALTIELAAERMDMDPTHLAKIEAGSINVSFVSVVRIAKGLKVSLKDLFVDAE